MSSKSKSKSSSKSKTTSLVSVSSELDKSDLLDDLYYSIQYNNDNKRAISVLRKHPYLADYEYKDTVEYYIDLKKTTPLMLCCYYSNYDVLKELLNGKYTVNIEYKNEHNQTPLTMAGGIRLDETLRKFKIIKLLIKRGANINHMDIHGGTLFRGVCTSFYEPHISYLLKIPGLDINKRKEGEDSPFHILIGNFCGTGYHHEYIKILKKMINDPRLDINIKGYNGETVLHILSSIDRQYDHNYSVEAMKKLVNLLITNGANADVKAGSGVSPLNNDIVKECYEEYVRRKLNQAENRLVLAKLGKKLNDEDARIDEGILIKISKEIPFLSEKQLNVIDKKILSEELFKKVRNEYQGEKLDNMVEVYDKQLKNPKLSKKMKKSLKKQKRNYKIRKNISLKSSDLSLSRNSRSSPSEELRDAIKMSIREARSNKSSSSRKSRSLRSSEELDLAIKMSIREAKSGSKNKKKKTIKK
tara:strand:- start:727 stop:2142 length:1416 start_codon:yes stop_codon:yes gene_type:complete